MSSYRGATAHTPGASPRGDARSRRGQSLGKQDDPATGEQPGRKPVAGLVGSAPLVLLDAAAAWAVPSSAALAAMTANVTTSDAPPVTGSARPGPPQINHEGGWQDLVGHWGKGLPHLPVTPRAPVLPRISVPPLMTPGSATDATTTTGRATTAAGATGASSTTSGNTANSAATGIMPVFSSNGGQIGVAVVNPATQAVELVGQGGAVLGVIEQRNEAINLLGAGGAVIGSLTVSPVTGQMILSVPDAAGTGATTTAGGQGAAMAVPVFDVAGTQIGAAVLNQAIGLPELIGTDGNVLGLIQQQPTGAIALIGAGGTVIGSFTTNPATGQEILTAHTPATAPAATAPAAPVTTATSATASAQQPGATSAAVPVFDSSDIQIGLAATNPATGAVELLGASGGTILGVIAQQSNAINLIGAGGTVLGSFAIDQATGHVLFVPAA